MKKVCVYRCDISESESLSFSLSDYVKISSVNGRFQFDVRNPVSEYISSNIISNYFNKGYSTKSTLKSDSIPHGLGLYEVKKIIIKNKGEIFADCLTFENEYEMRFCFTL